MWVKNLYDCNEIVANDLCRLRELLHPEHDGLKIGYSLAHARIEPGARTIRHHLQGASEVYYLLEGRGTMHIDNEDREVTAGDAILIPAGAVQYLVNTGEEPIEFLAIVEPAWRTEIDHRHEEG
jgi:mannose-6-phosphate isomerase-like protein (cupin superfamily)